MIITRKYNNKYHKKLINKYNTHLRLSIFKSNKHIYAQIIDDTLKHTLISCSTLDKKLKRIKNNCLKDAYLVGIILGFRALAKNINMITFVRKENSYLGQVKAIVEGIRYSGLLV